MEAETEKVNLTVQLSKKDFEFAERFARDHRLTVTDLVDRYFQALQLTASLPIEPEVEKISGIIPAEDGDYEDLYRDHLLRKH